MTQVDDKAPRSRSEVARLAELEAHRVLDTPPEVEFDDLVALASEICGTPIALISLVDSSRQWFKAKVGLEAPETPRSLAFCAHAIQQDEPFVVADAMQDDRFKDNPLVVGQPNVRFYAGFPLRMPSGNNLGTLCVIDDQPRTLNSVQMAALERLRRQAVSQLRLRRAMLELTAAKTYLAKKCGELEQFASTISHDLQEPIRTVHSFVDLFVEEFGNDVPAEAKVYLDFATSGAARATQMIHDLLSYAKAGDTEGFQTVNLNTIVEQVISGLASTVRDTGAEIIVDALPSLEGQPVLLQQMFQNLLGNALKFRSTSAPRVTISVENETAACVLAVRDNGRGIAREVQSDVFRLFCRAQSSDTDGTGIGLSIVQRVVEAHRGEIGLESEPGKGSTFFIRLPLIQNAGVPGEMDLL